MVVVVEQSKQTFDVNTVVIFLVVVGNELDGKLLVGGHQVVYTVVLPFVVVVTVDNTELGDEVEAVVVLELVVMDLVSVYGHHVVYIVITPLVVVVTVERTRVLDADTDNESGGVVVVSIGHQVV